MKKVIRGIGVVLLVCAVILFLAAGEMKDASQGTYVSTGVVIDGVYKEIGNGGYMGYNQEGVETAGSLQGLAAVAGLFGAGLVVASVTMKDEQKPQY